MKKTLLSFIAILCSIVAMADGYSVNFKSSQGDWTIKDVVLPEGISYVWKQDSKYGMKASAYANSTKYATESWLISPAIELKQAAGSNAITLKFNQAGKYFGDVASEASVWVSEDAQSWTQLSTSATLDGSSWTFIETTCDLTAKASKTIYIGFKYISTESAAATWEISDVAIEGIDCGTIEPTPTVDISNTPETAYTVTKALDLIAAGEGLDTKVYVKGTVLPDGLSISTDYGNATYYISDGTNKLEVYRGYGLKGNMFTSEDELQDGDEVIVYGKLVDYNGTKEIDKESQLYSINGKTSAYTCTGDGTLINPYTTEDITSGVYVADDTIKNVWVKGTILGNCNTSKGTTLANDSTVATNLAIGNADGTFVIPVQLPKGIIRDNLNLVDHSDYMGKTIYIYGDILKYCGAGGIKSPTDYSWDGTNTNIKTLRYSTITRNAVFNLSGAKVTGNISKGVYIVDGQKKLVK